MYLNTYTISKSVSIKCVRGVPWRTWRCMQHSRAPPRTVPFSIRQINIGNVFAQILKRLDFTARSWDVLLILVLVLIERSRYCFIDGKLNGNREYYLVSGCEHEGCIWALNWTDWLRMNFIPRLVWIMNEMRRLRRSVINQSINKSLHVHHTT